MEWQEANFDRDSALGRELLYLIANDDWLRATCESIEIERSDSIETKIKVEVDFDRITHEAFSNRPGSSLWLPILVLPPPRHDPIPDPLSTLLVTAADGSLLASLPSADVHHRIAAALAEVILAIAVARLADVGTGTGGQEGAGFIVERWHRHLLSAAIYRLLRKQARDADEANEPDRKPAAALPRKRSSEFPLDVAKSQLDGLLSQYSRLLGPPHARPDSSESPLLYIAKRAADLFCAFSFSAIIVVAVERSGTPTVLSVAAPSRILRNDVRRKAERTGSDDVSRLREWATRQHASLRGLITATAGLEIGLVLPSADADRKVQVNLPAGVSFPACPAEEAAELDIDAEPPLAARDLGYLLKSLETELAHGPVRSGGSGKEETADAEDAWRVRCQLLADLALDKLDATREALRDHHIYSADLLEDQRTYASTAPTAQAGPGARLMISPMALKGKKSRRRFF